MNHCILRGHSADESWFEEGCWIQEWSNHPDDPGCSVARARVPAGAWTRWHRLHDTIERYVVLEGRGRVEIAPGSVLDEAVDGREIGPGDVVIIPAGAGQRVHAFDADLVFLAICTPRFEPGHYEDIDPAR